jgi:tripartite-type tricarboxylate transporter receptor subunit TctC
MNRLPRWLPALPAVGAVALATLLAAAPATAQPYPSRVVKIVVPYPPGGSTDIVGRYVGQKLSEVLGQPVIIDNRPGAGTNIGTEAVVKSPPDGYTLLLASFANGVNRSLFKNLSFDPTRDLTGISLISLGPIIMTVPPDSPVNTLQEFVARARAEPGKYNYGVGGAGSSAHLAAEMLRAIAGVKLEPVMYKGGAAALQDLIAGRVHVLFDNPQILIPLEKAGKVKLLAVTGRERASFLPHLPTMIESGVPGYEVYSWYGLMAPARTPPEVIRTIEGAMAKIVAMPDAKARFVDYGLNAIGSNAKVMNDFFQGENHKWEKVVRDANIQLE